MSASQTPGAAGVTPAGNDPSMEDILASIRRILSEEDPAAHAAPAAPAASPVSTEQPPAAEEKHDDVLVLDPSMLVVDEEEEEAVMVAAPPAEPPPPAPVEAPPPVVPVEILPPPTLLAPATEAAAKISVGNLIRSLATERTMRVHRDGPTIEDLVREELRPLLKHWLDANLPDLVERLVQAEIERVVHRALP